MSLQPDPVLGEVDSSASREALFAEIKRLRSENVDLKEQQEEIFHYIRLKVDQLLGVVGTVPLKPEELDDKTLIKLDPIGIVSDSFCQVLEHLHDTNEKLRVAHDELQAIFDSAPIGVLVLDRDRRILTCNRNAEKHLLRGDVDILGRKCYEVICQSQELPDQSLLPDQCLFPDQCLLYRAMQEGTTCRQQDWLIDDRNYDVIATPVRDDEGNISCVVLVYDDVTSQRQLEHEMARSLKLESLGLLAGGLAHDFNNFLAAILNNVTLARLHTEPTSKACSWLQKTEDAASRAQHLTQQLLTFAKGGLPVVQEVAIDKLVCDSVSFALSGSNVQCNFSIPHDLRPVKVDPGQIDQVIRNLIINANQAMPGGGKIEVLCRDRTVTENDTSLITPGNYVVFTISDNGVGIAPENLNKIYDPYFSTKVDGNGLGLAISHAIISKHQGHIMVKSELGVGTSFEILLPATEPAEPPKVTAEPPEVTAESLTQSGSGRILVMDDEEIVRETTADLLTYVGYSVITAVDGRQAIQLYQEARERQEPIDIVILDLTVPGGMGGEETMRELHRLDPEVVGIATSGYCNNPVMANYLDYAFKGVLAKPCKLETMQKVIEDLLVK